MTTYSPKASEIQRQRHVIDASDQVLGRMATRVARLLMGKDKPGWVPHMDTGDYVVVVNAVQVRVTGKKAKDKVYYHHTSYPGGLRHITLEDLMASHPERVVEEAVKGMLPHTRLGKAMGKKLTVHAGGLPAGGARSKRETQ